MEEEAAQHLEETLVGVGSVRWEREEEGKEERAGKEASATDARGASPGHSVQRPRLLSAQVSAAPDQEAARALDMSASSGLARRAKPAPPEETRVSDAATRLYFASRSLTQTSARRAASSLTL